MEKQLDKRGKLDEEVFAYRITKDNKVFVSWYGKHVTTLSGAKAEAFTANIKNADSKQAQLLMAKATGHFKHGNEKMDKRAKLTMV